jgi:hypothetical protein
MDASINIIIESERLCPVSRRTVSSAMGSSSIDARLTIAARKAAIERRKPPPDGIPYTDRGSAKEG